MLGSINIVAFVPTNLESEESWSAPGDLRALAAEYDGWEAPVVEAIGALDVKLSADDIVRIEKAMPADAVAGDRYGLALMTHLDSEHTS